MSAPLEVGDAGPNGGVIATTLIGEGATLVYVEVVAFAGSSLGTYEVHVYTRGPRGGLHYLARTRSTTDLRRAADVRYAAASATDNYVADVVRAHTQPSLLEPVRDD
jgi:hypothetical protein